MRIILVGMPRVGKSTIGKVLAKRLNLTFFDSDVLLSKKFGGESASILFGKLGEKLFRDEEYNAIRSLLASEQDFVLATGGGSLENPKLKKLLQAETYVVYITASLETIAERIFAGLRSGKPLPKFLKLEKSGITLQGKSKNISVIVKALKPLFDKRSINYKSVARIQIENTGDIDDVVDKILSVIKLR